jgi:hypothetical protein
MTSTGTPITIILGIPGPWASAQELESALSRAQTGYTLQDGLLIGASGEHAQACQLELVEHDPDLRRAFELANRLSLTPADLEQIGAHRHTAYLIGRGGALDAAREMMQAGAALLQAGGYGVKVETAGVAHSARDWLMQAERSATHVGALYIAYVALVGSRGQYYSCGMHNLGCCDAIVSGLDAAQAGQLLRGFLMSLIHEAPLLISGQTRVSDGAGGQYRLTHEACSTFTPDEPFYNPFGLWRLTRQ